MAAPPPPPAPPPGGPAPRRVPSLLWTQLAPLVPLAEQAEVRAAVGLAAFEENEALWEEAAALAGIWEGVAEEVAAQEETWRLTETRTHSLLEDELRRLLATVVELPPAQKTETAQRPQVLAVSQQRELHMERGQAEEDETSSEAFYGLPASLEALWHEYPPRKARSAPSNEGLPSGCSDGPSVTPTSSLWRPSSSDSGLGHSSRPQSRAGGRVQGLLANARQQQIADFVLSRPPSRAGRPGLPPAVGPRLGSVGPTGQVYESMQQPSSPGDSSSVPNLLQSAVGRISIANVDAISEQLRWMLRIEKGQLLEDVADLRARLDDVADNHGQANPRPSLAELRELRTELQEQLLAATPQPRIPRSSPLELLPMPLPLHLPTALPAQRQLATRGGGSKLPALEPRKLQKATLKPLELRGSIGMRTRTSTNT